MAVKRITDLAAASALVGSELIELSQLSTVTKIAAATLSAVAADNSYNDSANGFLAAGFAVGHRVKVTGFASGANNILVGTITALTAARMVIGGTDGDVIVDEAAGAAVTITRWLSARATAAAFAASVPTVTVDNDTTLAADSTTSVPSQHAVKTAIASAIIGLLSLQGSTDCSANPNYPVAKKGHAYVVTVAGRIGGGSGAQVDVGDVFFALADNAGGTQAAVGASWDIIEHNLVGAVVGAGALLAANNLSDLANLVTARNNLDVYSKAQSDAAFSPIAPNVQTVASAATVTPTFSNDLVKITAQAVGLTLANWSGTPVPGWGEAIRIKDNGSARGITYDTKYRAMGVTLPTTTVVGKTLYLGVIYNSDDDKFDVVAVAQEA